MLAENAHRTVTVVCTRTYPEGEGPTEAQFDRGMEYYILLEGDQLPPPGRINEKIAAFSLEGSTQVERSRLILESKQPIAGLHGQEVVDGYRPYLYASDAMPKQMFGVFGIARTGAGEAMGIRNFRTFDPPIPMH